VRYTLTAEIKLIEIEEPTAPAEPKPGADPIEHMARGVTTMLTAFGPASLRFPTPPGGLNYNKTVIVSAGSFAGIAEILSQFHALIQQIELERA
jgi:hypothetical protein